MSRTHIVKVRKVAGCVVITLSRDLSTHLKVEVKDYVTVTPIPGGWATEAIYQSSISRSLHSGPELPLQ